MRILRLELTQFKSHIHRVFDFKKKVNVFLGKNGVGKTNILESIYYLTSFKSIQNLADSLLIHHGQDFFRIQAFLEDEMEIVVRYSYRKKRISIANQDVKKLSEYFGFIPCIMAGPSDIFIYHGGSEERRKLMDFSISSFDKTYLDALNEYHAILDQRNAHLKDSEITDNLLLDTYDQKLVPLGDQIHQKRLKFITELIPLINAWYRKIANSAEGIVVNYESQLLKGNFSELLQSSREKDKILERTTQGIHRDEIAIEMNSTDFKKIASQGQQRTLLYALRLAQAELISKAKKTKVIFLLDDFSQYLDSSRIANVLAIIPEIDFIEQWFITETKSEIFDPAFDMEKFEIN